MDFAKPKKKLRFGQFILDPSIRALMVDDEAVEVTPTNVEVLIFLVEKAGTPVLIEEIYKGVWKNSDVQRHYVHTAVNSLRNTLGKDSIRTVRGGYVFVIHVEELVEGNAGGNLASQQRTGSTGVVPDRQRAARIAAIVGVSLLTVGGIVASWNAVGSTPSIRNPTEPAKISDSVSAKIAPMLSDGSRIYVTERVKGRFQIAQVTVAGSRQQPIPLPIPLENPELIDVFPDGTKLLVRSLKGSRTEYSAPLWIYPLPEGEPSRFADILAADAAWSPDGKRLIYSTEHDVFSASGDGRNPTKICSLDGVAWWFRWAADQKRIRFTTLDLKTNVYQIWEISPEGKNLRQIAHDVQNPCCGSWSADGRSFFFQAPYKGTHHTWVVRDSIRAFHPLFPPVRLTSGPVDHRSPLPSRDGRRLFVRRTQLKSEVVKYEPTIGAWIPFLPNVSAAMVTFSPEGDWLAFISVPEWSLWRMRGNGGEMQRLTPDGLQAAIPRWSPSGKQLAFMGRQIGQPWRIHISSAFEGTTSALEGPGDDVADPSWFPDGNELLLGKGAAASQKMIYRFNLLTNEFKSLSNSTGLFSPVLSPDAKRLVAIDTHQNMLTVYDLKTHARIPLTSMGASGGYPSWSRDQHYVYFLYRDPSVGSTVRRVNTLTNRVEDVVNLESSQQPSFIFGRWIGLTPDGIPLALRDLGETNIYAFDIAK